MFFFWLLYLPQDVYFDDESTAGMHDEIEDDQFESIFVQADPVVTVDNLLEQVTDREITVDENTTLIVW
jgi:alcohol dehydrogenase class IV